jgi:RNA polymerase sigma factor (sigma-70 family)
MPVKRDDPTVIALVTRAANGDQDAWNEIIERYEPLVWSICMRYRLRNSDIEDVGQTVWLLLVEQLGKLREPAALPGWLATTTQRECLRALTSARKSEDAATKLDEAALVVDASVIEQEILAAERNAALRLALRELPPHCQQLLGMLISDPPRSYAEISAALHIPIGSIGPLRARCLERLRRSGALMGLSTAEPRVNSAGGEKRA